MSDFQTTFQERVAPLLAAPETLGRAVDEIQAMMPTLAPGEDRSRAYQWLGSIYINIAANTLESGEAEQAREQFALVEEFLSKSIEEQPARPEPRLQLARYFLSFGYQYQEALEVLAFPEPMDTSTMQGAMHEHHRLALKSIGLAMTKRIEQAAVALEEAYNPVLLDKVSPRFVDIASLDYLAQRGFPFTEESAGAIAGLLRGRCLLSDEQLEMLKNRLAGKRHF